MSQVSEDDEVRAQKKKLLKERIEKFKVSLTQDYTNYDTSLKKIVKQGQTIQELLEKDRNNGKQQENVQQQLSIEPHQFKSPTYTIEDEPNPENHGHLTVKVKGEKSENNECAPTENSFGQLRQIESLFKNEPASKKRPYSTEGEKTEKSQKTVDSDQPPPAKRSRSHPRKLVSYFTIIFIFTFFIVVCQRSYMALKNNIGLLESKLAKNH